MYYRGLCHDQYRFGYKSCFVFISESNIVLTSISSLTSLDDIGQSSDDPQPKNKGIVGEYFILSKLVLFKKLLQLCHSCTLEWLVMRKKIEIGG